MTPHEPVCVRNKLFHAHNRWFQFRLCRGHMCFQLPVIVRVQADYCSILSDRQLRRGHYNVGLHRLVCLQSVHVLRMGGAAFYVHTAF